MSIPLSIANENEKMLKDEIAKLLSEIASTKQRIIQLRDAVIAKQPNDDIVPKDTVEVVANDLKVDETPKRYVFYICYLLFIL